MTPKFESPLRRMCEPERGDLTGDWRKLHNEKLHDLQSFPDIIAA
jgi:hypothetical protein